MLRTHINAEKPVACIPHISAALRSPAPVQQRNLILLNSEGVPRQRGSPFNSVPQAKNQLRARSLELTVRLHIAVKHKVKIRHLDMPLAEQAFAASASQLFRRDDLKMASVQTVRMLVAIAEQRFVRIYPFVAADAAAGLVQHIDRLLFVRANYI
ncbi:hypothetical protein D3C75_202690 [compost metagenome]